MKEMSDGKHCPACDKDIGIWPVFSAGLPSRVRCPHCKSRLSYGDTGTLVACLAAVVLMVGAGSYFFVGRFYAITRLEFHLLSAVLALALLLALDFAVALYLRNARALKIVD
jgi:hypothetical protein